jgi:hypothetical protein
VSIDWLQLDPQRVCLSVQVFDSGSTDDHPISTVTFQPALAPAVNSIFVIGVVGAGATTSDKARLVTLIDAPEKWA